MNGNGNGSGFKPEEIVQVQGRSFPVIAGRLRIIHETCKDRLSIATEIVAYELDVFAVARAKVETASGCYTATGVATASRDPKLADSLLELSETRAVARALRFAGIGVESCGLEELGAGSVLEGTAPRQEAGPTSGAVVPFKPANGNGTKASTPASSAQLRCIRTLARKLGMDAVEVVEKVFPDQALDALSLSQASQVIDRAKARVGANGNGGGESHAS